MGRLICQLVCHLLFATCAGVTCGEPRSLQTAFVPPFITPRKSPHSLRPVRTNIVSRERIAGLDTLSESDVKGTWATFRVFPVAFEVELQCSGKGNAEGSRSISAERMESAGEGEGDTQEVKEVNMPQEAKELIMSVRGLWGVWRGVGGR